VGTDGTIDWYCCPRFDSPSVFAAILDADHGGLFRISPDCDGWSSKQLYLPDTNVLAAVINALPIDPTGPIPRDFPNFISTDWAEHFYREPGAGSPLQAGSRLRGNGRGTKSR